LKRECNSFGLLQKNYGQENAKKIYQRILELQAAPSLIDLPLQSRPHPLSNNLDGLFAVDVKHPYRILLKPDGDFDENNYESITDIKIFGIKDYHKGGKS